MTRVTIDFETKSYADLKIVGEWVYSQHPTTEVICLCYKIDDGPVQDWVPGWNHSPYIPEDLGDAIYDPKTIVEAHRYSFELSIWRNILAKRHQWPDIRNIQWRDSMAAACYYSLPAKLDTMARVLLGARKDPEGTRLITKYSKLHLPTAKQIIPDEDLSKFVAYCRKDVELEHRISAFLGDLPEREMDAWTLDMEMNQLGLHIDLEGVAAAAAIVDQRSTELTAKFIDLVGFKPTQRDKVLEWVRSHDVAIKNYKGDTLEEMLESDNPPPEPVRTALLTRLKINKASAGKLTKMAAQTSADGSAKYQVRYHGAATGRWTADGFGVLNMAKGMEDADPDTLVSNILLRDAHWLDCVYGDAMAAVGGATRHWITARPCHRIIAGDFESIEAVGLACLAGEDWKVDAFRQKKPIYEISGCQAFGMDPAIVDQLGKAAFKAKHGRVRFVGKTKELACGYQGWLGAWLKFDDSGQFTDDEIKEFMGGWRKDHPKITGWWKLLERAAVEAVRRPGLLVPAGTCSFQTVDDWLTAILPDGKRLWYWKPHLVLKMPKWHDPEKNEDCKTGNCGCEPKPTIHYWATKTGQWQIVSTYGGKLCENLTQASCRQILVAAKVRARAAGYPIILSVYDEVVTEPKVGFGSKEELQSILAGPLPSWCEDWPVRVDVFEGSRYRK